MKNIKYIVIFLLSFIVFTVLGWIISDNIINFITASVPSSIKIIALNPIEVFTTVFNIAILFSLAVNLPLILYMIIKYVTPAMKLNEKSIMRKLLLIGPILFTFGAVISFIGFVIFGLKWFANFNVAYGFETLWSLQQTINTILILSFISGIVFEFPLVLYYLIKNNILSFELTTKSRAFFLIGLLLIIGLITPDGSLFTQLFLSIPIYGLMELSIYFGNKNKEEILC